ncbi:hypothetical protein AMTRI_Chr09g36900 [Amborella trichopoda]
MDFDEYEYLEKTVENPELSKKSLNGEVIKSGGDGDCKNSRGREDESGRETELRSTKRARSEEGSHENGRSSRDDERERERHRFERDREREKGRDERDREREKGRDEKDREREKGRDEKDREREKGRDEKDRKRSSKEHSDRSSRDRDRAWERDRNRDRGRGRVREDRNGREKDSERGRDIYKERDREGERERESEQERSRRSSSNSGKHRDRDREAEREKELTERDKDKDIRDRDSRHFKDKKEQPEPEADPERDQRTVFAYQICLKADERDVYEFFSRAGKVRDVRLIMDRNSRRSKGVGYIEFYDAMSVPMAIALSGQMLFGQPVMVKPSEAEKNLVQPTPAGGQGGLIGPYSGGARRLYVGNLHFNMTEDQLRQVFEPFGHVELVQLPHDPETGHFKGFGFVQFARLEDARAAQSLNGQLDIAGRTIKVSALSDQVGMQDVGANAADFDDDDDGGLSLNARSRAMLMQKLDRSGAATSIDGSLGTPAVTGPAVSLPLPAATLLGSAPLVSPLISTLGQPSVAGLSLPIAAAIASPVISIGVPSECLLLKNMFDPKAETEPDFDVDIKEDVQEECSKFGTLKHIFVDKISEGHVYLRFDSATAAIGAQRAMHGRWFAGKMITATFMLPQNYEAKFPNSK